MATARLFLALWPDAEAREALAGWQRRWSWPRGAAPVAPQKLHVTLHFLGDVPRMRLGEFGDGLAVPVEPMELRFGQAEVWRGGIAVATPLAPPDALAGLHRRLADALRRLDWPLERRPYRPHLTLARRALGASPPAEPLQCGWRVGSYALVESAGGYRTLREYR